MRDGFFNEKEGGKSPYSADCPHDIEAEEMMFAEPNPFVASKVCKTSNTDYLLMQAQDAGPCCEGQ